MKRLMVFSLMAVLSACGSDQPSDLASPPPKSDPSPSATGVPDVEPGEGVIGLRVAVRADQDAEPAVSTLTCTDDGATGTGSLAGDAEAACANAREHADLLVKGPPSDRMCAEIYGGPQTGTVTGTLDGKDVDQTFKRNNGCAMSDWDSLEPLLGPPPDQGD